MNDTLLAQAVAKASITRSVVVERDGLTKLPAVVHALQPSRPCCIVADATTMRVAGDRAASLLQAGGVQLEPAIVLDESPRVKPRADLARDVAARLAQRRALPIGVGAGVINDVT